MTTNAILYRYQERLRESLEIIGYVTILSGPVSICRKLCREVIGSNMVTINCQETTDPALFWHHVGLHCTPAADFKGTENQKAEYLYLLKEISLAYCIEQNKLLVVEDFHLAGSKMQVYMAQQLKDSARRGLRVVVLLHASQIDLLLQANPDLQGRISIIRVPGA